MLGKRPLQTVDQPDAAQELIKEQGDFNRFGISKSQQETLIATGIHYLFPIQQKTYPLIFEGKDVLAKDRTGSGKTLAFSLPTLESFRSKGLFKNRRGQLPLALILVPTRELAIQVASEFKRFKASPNEFRVEAIYGQSDIYTQIRQLQEGVEIVVGTPGRVKDLIERGKLLFGELQTFILDETDQMLDQGFQQDIEKIYDSIANGLKDANRQKSDIQILLFSATVPEWVRGVASKYMKPNYEKIDMVSSTESRTSSTVVHLKIVFQTKNQKVSAIGDIVSVYGGSQCKTIIFVNKKAEANDIHLNGNLKVDSDVLHGDIPQKQREVVFQSFREGKIQCMIATNVAARGLDIPQVDLIVQLSPPDDIDSYIHRSGRTGRAGKNGTCITLVTRQEDNIIRRIEQMARMKIQLVGIPQIEDIIRASAISIEKSFENVSEKVLPFFKNTAKEILQLHTAEDALQRALAIISGYTEEFKQRSILGSLENHITYIIEGTREIRSKGYIWNILRDYYSEEIINDIRGMRMLDSNRGVIFDLHKKHELIFDKISEEMSRQGLKVSKPDELPTLKEESKERYGGYQRDYDEQQRPQQFNRNQNNNRQDFQGGNRFDRSQSQSQNQTQNRGYERGPQRSDTRDDNRNNPDEKDLQRLFVSNISYSIDVNQLREFVEGQGFKPQDVFIVTDQDKKSKGFGYIRFNTEADAQNAIDRIPGQRLDGKGLRCEFANKRKN